MTDPVIERTKTEVYFTDAAGVEWQVVDARRRADRKLWKQYPGCDDAELRYFIRSQPRNGATPQRVIELRRYRFAQGESRWFLEAEWQRQLASAPKLRPGS